MLYSLWFWILAVGLLLVFLYYWFRPRSTYNIVFPTKSTIETQIGESDVVDQYLQSIHPKVLAVKLPSQSSPPNDYTDYLEPISPKYQPFLEYCVSYLHNNYLHRFLHQGTHIEWSFVQSVDRLELDMPYTLHTSIVLPRSRIRRYGNEPTIRPLWVQTLLHECIHVAQRKRPGFSSTWLQEQWGDLIHIRRPTPEEHQTYVAWCRPVEMTNPDSHSDPVVYVWNNGNRVIYPFLKVNSTNHSNTPTTEEYGVDLSTGEGKPLMEWLGETEVDPSAYTRYSHVSWYHPNEFQACVFAEDIYYGRMTHREWIAELFGGGL